MGRTPHRLNARDRGGMEIVQPRDRLSRFVATLRERVRDARLAVDGAEAVLGDGDGVARAGGLRERAAPVLAADSDHAAPPSRVIRSSTLRTSNGLAPAACA